MKEGWTYKKFEDALQKVKYTKKLQTLEYLQEGEIPIISQEEEYISGYWDNPEDAFIVDSPVVIFGDHSRVLKYIDFDFVLGADGVKILKPTPDLCAKFLYHFLKWYNIPSMGYSRHYKFLKEIKLPIPPVAQQQQIVSELDLLSDVIEKQKSQIEELDKLAQSTFYDMFGDPMTNEKGWEVKKIKEICRVITGNTPSRNNPTYYNNNYIEWIKTDNIKKESLYPSQAKEYLSEEGMKQGRIADVGSILMACIAGSLTSIGKCCILDRKVSFNQQINAIVPSQNLNSFFAYTLINALADYIRDNATNGMKHILTKSVLEELELPLPPLALQQEFAAKIEAIEQMKAKVRQSLKDSEELFNSRIDYYFN